MAKTGGISGPAVAAIAAGAVLVVSGIRNASVIGALRDVMAGRAPQGTAPVVVGGALGRAVGGGAVQDAPGGPDAPGTSAGSSGGVGGRIVAQARSWLGVMYRWGGTTRDGVDCSGLVYRCLNGAGIQVSRKTSNGYRTWSGAYDIPRAQAAAGDLVCYHGHIGIAVSNTEMIHAYRTGKPVAQQRIYNGQGGPIIRRVKG